MHFGNQWPLPWVFIGILIRVKLKKKKKENPSRPKGVIKWRENRHHYILTGVVNWSMGAFVDRVSTITTKATPFYPCSV